VISLFSGKMRCCFKTVLGFLVLDQKTNNKREEWAMTAKRISFLVAIFVLASLLMVNVASAAWYKCTIKRVGADSSGYIVYLTDTKAAPSFTNRWFVLNPSIGKELLAVALTAYTNNKIFYVSLPTITAGSTISAAYMMD
jgi:hypothetical protein